MISAQTVTVMIVDDHPVVRDGLNAMLSTEPDIQVVGEAGTGEDALAFLAHEHPSVVLMDLLLPDIGGSEVIRRACAIPAIVARTSSAASQKSATTVPSI